KEAALGFLGHPWPSSHLGFLPIGPLPRGERWTLMQRFFWKGTLGFFGLRPDTARSVAAQHRFDQARAAVAVGKSRQRRRLCLGRATPRNPVVCVADQIEKCVAEGFLVARGQMRVTA